MMKKKPLRHLPPMKEEVQKIGSRKVGQSMKRLLEGINRVRELMIARQNLTPIQSQCDAVVASLGGGDCDVPPSIQADGHLSKQIAACKWGQVAQKFSRRRGRQSWHAADGGAAAFSLGEACADPLEPWGRLEKSRSPFGRNQDIFLE